MTLSYHIEAEITFLTSKDGGRKKNVTNGYRPQLHYDGRDWDACHEYPDVKQAEPGQKVRTYLTFLSPKNHAGRIYKGMAFLIREGKKIVGYGSVTRILDLPSKVS